MRNFILALILFLGVLFVLTRFAEVKAIGETLQQGDIRFILLAFGVQALWYLNVATSFKVIYRALHLEEKIETLYLAVAGANFVNVVAPSAGIGGMAVFLSMARRRGYSSARVTVAAVLYLFFDYMGFLCVLLLGIVVLLRRHNLTISELVASSVLLLIASTLLFLLILGMRSAGSLGSALAWGVRGVNRLLRPFIHHQYLSEERARLFARDAAEGLKLVRQKPSDLVLPAFLALSSKVLMISILFLVFLAFQIPYSLGTLIAGFSVSYLFLIVSPTPAGIGVVEGTMTLVLSSMYISLGAATVITLAFRGITFWVPLAFGGFALRILHYESNHVRLTNGRE